MAKEWTDDEVQDFIRQTVAIAKEDKIATSIAGLHKRLDDMLAGGSNPNGTGNDPSGSAPPKTDPKPSGDKNTSAKRSIWWGEVSE